MSSIHTFLCGGGGKSYDSVYKLLLLKTKMFEERVSVSLDDCKRFLQFQKLDRTPKNIQDKVRSLS